MTPLHHAVMAYLRREKEANAQMRGADHARIMDDVAREYGVDLAVLQDAVIDASFSGAC